MSRRRPSLRRAWSAVLLAAVAVGCSAGPAATPPSGEPPQAALAPPDGGAEAAVVAPADAAPPASAASAAEVESRVDQLRAQAAEVEPGVTELMKRLAAEAGGELVKLEHRLKTKASALRKVRAELACNSSLTPRQVQLDDCLRYTLEVPDQPPGHHVEVIRTVLAELRQAGHRVVRLKNYWPADDNYSGVNGVLQAPNGLLWELQFHTPASVAAAARTRAWYEELRRLDTPVERKRELFDRMTAEWNRVPIPRGILEPGALGQHDDIIERSRP